MELVLIPPNALRSVWDFVRAGLATMPPEDWIAEDVYHAIRSGESALHVALGNAGPCGFLVLRRHLTEFTQTPELHVWLAYNAGDADVIAAGETVLKETATRMGAARITFGSPRKGWAKRYRPVTTTYEITP